MKYYLVTDLGVKVEAKDIDDLYEILGGKDAVIEENGGVEPDICELTEDEYYEDDGYDVI